MNGIFKRLLNVKGMVVESARIVDGPLRPEPVLEVYVRAGKAAPRCSRCGRKRRGYGRGGGVRRWRHRDFGCWRVGQVAMMPRVDCPGCGVVVASAPGGGARRPVHPGCSNAGLEAFNNGIKVAIRMAYGFHHVTNLIGLVMLRCGGLDIRLPQPAI